MSYSKSIFFIPVWYDQFKPFTQALAADERWTPTDSKKVWAGYLFRYAADMNRNKELFASFTLKNPESLKVYLFGRELPLETPPQIQEVRFSCFATGVGFMEFWVNYSNMTPQQIGEFSYLFKKATSKCKGELPDQQRALYDVAQNLLPAGVKAQLFFATSARFKYECNCFHFIHVDEQLPDQAALWDTLYHLSRSYHSNMPTALESAYDIMYQAGDGDYWAGSPEGLVNIVYDYRSTPEAKTDYYLHNLKPQRLQLDYYFMYLLLLNQKYSAVEYIRMVALSLDSSTRDVERLNRRIVRLKNTFSFNVISDDSVIQNIYSKMYTVLEIKNLLEDVIENESQMEYLQEAKHMNDDRLSNKYLLGISILSLFSALIDSASYFDRVKGMQPISTLLSFICVLAISAFCVAWVVRSGRK